MIARRAKSCAVAGYRKKKTGAGRIKNVVAVEVRNTTKIGLTLGPFLAFGVSGSPGAGLIPDNASLFTNNGTMIEAASEALIDHDGLMVITININIVNHLRVHSKIGASRPVRFVRVFLSKVKSETAWRSRPFSF